MPLVAARGGGASTSPGPTPSYARPPALSGRAAFARRAWASDLADLALHDARAPRRAPARRPRLRRLDGEDRRHELPLHPPRERRRAGSCRRWPRRSSRAASRSRPAATRSSSSCPASGSRRIPRTSRPAPTAAAATTGTRAPRAPGRSPSSPSGRAMACEAIPGATGPPSLGPRPPRRRLVPLRRLRAAHAERSGAPRLQRGGRGPRRRTARVPSRLPRHDPRPARGAAAFRACGRSSRRASAATRTRSTSRRARGTRVYREALAPPPRPLRRPRRRLRVLCRRDSLPRLRRAAHRGDRAATSPTTRAPACAASRASPSGRTA